MNRFLYSLIMVLISCVVTTAQTSLEGKVTDDISGEPILFGSVALYQNGALVTGVETDIDGNYYFGGIEPGTYDVEASYVGYTSRRIADVVVKAGKVTRLDFQITEGVLADLDIQIVAYKEPLIDIDNTTSGGTVTAEEIRQLPVKGINNVAATTAGLSSIDGGAINIRGSRSNATNYIIDGIRVSAANIPESEIEQMQVLTGGIPASVGDLTGGAISITTRSFSNELGGGIEVESSEFLDAFGYNQYRANLSGPILKNSMGRAILGFRFSGQYQTVTDDNRSATGEYRATAEQIAALEAEPFSTIGGTRFPSAELLGADDIAEPLKTTPNEQDRDYTFTGKIGARPTENIDISLSGSFDDSRNRFTPGSAWSLLNWTNNPYNLTSGFRGNFKIKHKIGGTKSNGDESAQSTSSFRNANYTLTAGYERRFSSREDVRHEDNLFRYGYFGSSERSWNPFANVVSDTSLWEGDLEFVFGVPFAHQAYQEVNEGFTANPDINGALAAYNQRNGILTDPLNSVWSDLYSNVGAVYNQFQDGQSERITFDIRSGFDFLPGGSEKGRHSIEFGLLYEQRIQRNYFLAPRRLWELANLNANRHIIGVDPNNPIGTFSQNVFGQDIEFTQYQTLITPESDQKFYQSVRELTGQSINEYVNVDGINPDDLSLDMFSAGELLTLNIVDYYGYDHLGNQTTGSISFDDFFTARDADGRRTFPVAPFEPIYGGAYIQDRFSFKDIIFRLGLRVDYYDANSKVLKDPYSLYEIESANEFYTRTGQEQPTAVEDDYSVYIAGPESESVVGFRSGDEWFLPNGTSVSGGNVIFGGGVVTPALKGASEGAILDIQDPNFDTSVSFEDYKPQINWMPRLAFSFPISQDAGFFAHYDILVQRPAGNSLATASDYFYFSEERTSNNPNLKPSKTIDYEVGFQQKLTDNSAVTLSAYYRELRDQIQIRTLTNTFPLPSYQVFDNLDFGTTKGFSVEYDYRRSANLQFNINYTLQFADGSGSDATSSRGLNSRGAIRTLSALNFDERHRLNTNIDFRYGSGKRYNGPRIGDMNILEDFGVNLQLITVSGRPYTKNRTVEPRGGTGFLGGINEARLPWTFTANLRVNKNFKIGSKTKPLNVNVYLRVENLFDTRNTIGVFQFTGDPNDDGYLLSSFGEDQISQVVENGQILENFLAAYNWRLLDSGNFTLPRRMYLGAIVEF